MSTVLQRIEAGAARLDQVESGDWRTRIKLDLLDITLEDSCVLGQLYGDYCDGLDEIGMDRDDAPDYGFEATGYDHTAVLFDARALTEGWRLYLESFRP